MLLSKGLPINQDSIMWNALSRAVALNQHETIEILINRDPKSDLECVVGQYTGEEALMGYTALQLACYWYDSKCVKLLVDAGANVGFRNSYVNEKRQTRLHFIQRGTRVPTVELLAAAMAPIDTQDEDEYTPLAIAVREGNSGVARHFVERGTKHLTYSVANGDLSLVKFLVDAGADREAIDPKYGKSLLYTALDIRDDWRLRRMVRYLAVEAKAPINKFGGELGYPIICAANSVEYPVTPITVVKFLIRCKAEVNVADSQGRTALHFACVSASLERMNALVETGANVDTKDKFGRLPMHFAAGTDSTDSTNIVAYLLDQYKDMDINVADQDGWTPLIHLLEPNERARVTSEGIEEEWDDNFHEIKPGDRKPYGCDSCFMDIVGRQWQCVECPVDSSLCFECFDHRSDLHDLTHTFRVIEPLYRKEDSKGDEGAAAEAKNSDGEDFDLDGDY
ncbi:hypothetical protein M431DRAFT_476642 [Trichoderma harzianum CBS 226.95]|uniref:Uncharacterized protein n=1 Tax=Trichoderma harzianum CBS 226.95 TaxID=983964 RepID=A0A2T4ASS7_TRIHA|nr:hypothetical protein M431DRAFT_476642 [Trichoderma harzianum CBS 226.95]PTB60106.1 hypothetical protein M431DRAFT_476642 [Trichoderma harzianum CBS 226.95]